MNAFVPIALFGFLPFAIALFIAMPPRRAVLTAYVSGWLFLPMGFVPLPGLPDYGKLFAVSLGPALGILLFDFNRLQAFRPKWIDLPAAVLTFIPMITSITNGLGVYDGLANVLVHSIRWGVPYFVGRLYFTDTRALRDLAIALFVGGLVYVPFCLFEVRFSPQLHRLVYGIHQHSFVQSKRGGGFRPTVFMQHGLMVSMWMAMSSVTGVWLWKTKTIVRIWGIKTGWYVLVLVGTTLLCKSAGATALMVLGVGILFLAKWMNSCVPWICLLLVIPGYMVSRTHGVPSADQLENTAAMFFGSDRAGSLKSRLVNEDLLVEKALQRSVFGWGGWGRSGVTNDWGVSVVTIDGLWILLLGKYGLVGLISMTLMYTMAPILFAWRLPVRFWSTPAAASAAALNTVIILYGIDSLLNAMLNPILHMAMGGLALTFSKRVYFKKPLNA